MADSVACPSCGAANPAPPGDAPFFCGSCKSIIDRKGLRKRVSFVADAVDAQGASGAPPPIAGEDDPDSAAAFDRGAAVVRPSVADAGSAPAARTAPTGSPAAGPDVHGPSGNPPNAYVSRFGTELPQTAVGPGPRFAVGGSMLVGLTIAIVIGVIAGFALGWVSANVAAIPIVYAFAIGWLIKRGLAAGAGGGTPDRGLIGGAFLLLAVVASFAAFLFAGYMHDSEAGTDRFRATFGTTPSAAMADPEVAMRNLRARDPENDGRIPLPDGSVVRVEEAAQRLAAARATGKRPADGYDVELLAASGTPGFRGHLRMLATDGTKVRLVPRSSGIQIPGFGIILLWFAEFTVLLLTAVGRVD